MAPFLCSTCPNSHTSLGSMRPKSPPHMIIYIYIYIFFWGGSNEHEVVGTSIGGSSSYILIPSCMPFKKRRLRLISFLISGPKG